MFRRRGRTESDGESGPESMEPEELELEESAAEPQAPARPAGPWDVDDAPEDGPARLDLGAMQVPVLEGMEVRVEVDPEQNVVGATLVAGASALQLNCFAAPRTEGIWGEVREEIATSLREGGGSADDADGPLGPELRARIPAEVPGQGVTLQPARFVGVDGPRWFLRGLLTGPAATDPQQATALEEAFRGVVVVRGGDPMAPRDPLPLRLPREALEAAAEAATEEATQAHHDDLNPFERGPEITEVR